MTRVSSAALVIGGAALVFIATYFAMEQPTMTTIAVVAVGAVLLALNPGGRLVIFVGGIMALFQSATIPASVRGVFLAVVCAAAIPAINSIRRRVAGWLDVRRFVWPSVLLAAFIGLSVFAITLPGRNVEDWLRDATGYMLLLVAPIYGLDAALHMKRRTIEWLVLTVGFVGAFSFLVAWLSRRGVPLGGLDQFALASSLLVFPSVVMCLVYTYSKDGRARVLWASAAFVQIGMLTAAGGRSAIIYCAVLVGVFVVFGGMLGSWFRGTVTLLVTALVVGGALISLTAVLGIQEFLIGRYDWFDDISVESAVRDQSGQARLNAYGFMWQAFTESPLIGNGFGRSYQSVVDGLIVRGTFTLDTPFTYLAKFGILGTAVLIASLFGILSAAGRLGSATKHTRLQIGLLFTGSVAVWLAMLIGGAPHEQRGFSVQIALLVALAAAWVVSDMKRDTAYRVPDRPPRAAR